MADLYYKKKTECLFCKNEFETTKVKLNQAKFIKRDSDYCPYYEEENPLFYDAYVCPKCGFAFTEAFSSLRSSGYQQVMVNYINKFESVPDLTQIRKIDDALKAYKLALYSAQLANESNLIMGNLCLRIAWLNRYLNQQNEEQRFLNLALNLYIEIYETEDLGKLSMDKYTLMYLIGDIYNRLGDESNFIKWFSYIIEDKAAPVKILKQTKDRWSEYRENRTEKIK